MKQAISQMFGNWKHTSWKKVFGIAVIGFLLIPSPARAAGSGDILTLLQTIMSTIRSEIGGTLSEIQNLAATVNNFRQQIIWPVNQLNQAKAFVSSTRALYGGWMSQVQAIKNNSSTLANSSQLESVFRSGQAGNIAQLQRAYTTLYASAPPATQAKLEQRNMMDMDDALAQGSLKTAVLSDQTTGRMLTLADSLEQQSATAAPGSGPMLSTQAQVASLETQAYLAKVLAAELRQEAARLAHQNALLKQSAATTRSLENQVQQVLTHP